MIYIPLHGIFFSGVNIFLGLTFVSGATFFWGFTIFSGFHILWTANYINVDKKKLRQGKKY